MAQTFTGRKRVRKYFGHIREITEMQNLIEIQKASYDQFLMVDEPKGAAGMRACSRSSGQCSRSRIFPARRCWSL